eukprot:TRINITY_DN3188_c0_g1_i15.p1 TRINITY_DN3188_c0_g1~~TRINITY_DN3188_c0_g1_i15.p1  ORF type:complete len:243 (-),score=50.39 TRINITY_DN3188_c0_g1_i15:217-945(-)
MCIRDSFTIFAKFNEDTCRIAFCCFFSLSITAFITLAAITAVSAHGDDELIIFGLLVFSVFMQTATLGYLVYVLAMTCLNKCLTRDRILCALGMRVANFLVGVLAALTAREHKAVYGYALLGIAYLSCFDCVTGFAVLIVILILCFIGLIIEGIVRLIICNLNCPEQDVLVLRYKYQLFSYDVNIFGKNECVICLSDFNGKEEVVVLSCHSSHIFHEKCMIEWIQRSDLCPVCRKEISFLTD